MGHFYCSNISHLVVDQINEKGAVSIREMVDYAEANGIKIQAAEGEYEDRCMLEQGIETLVFIHIDRGTIQPVLPDNETAALWFDYREQEFEWEDEERYPKVMEIRHEFTTLGRSRYDEGKVPHVEYIET